MKITGTLRDYGHLPELLLILLDDEFHDLPQWQHWSVVMKLGYAFYLSQQELSRQSQPPGRDPRLCRVLSRHSDTPITHHFWGDQWQSPLYRDLTYELGLSPQWGILDNDQVIRRKRAEYAKSDNS